MDKLIITTNSCSSTILLTKDGKIISAYPLDADNFRKVEEACKNPAGITEWIPNWDNDGRTVEEHGEVVLRICADGAITGDLDKVKALSEQG